MYINAVLALFRAKDLPVIVIEDINENEGRTPGSPRFETSTNINLISDDPRIHKTYGNAFIKTNLHQLLQDLEVDTLFLTGFAATQCVLSTYRGAEDLDYTPLLIRGSLADEKQEQIHFVENIHNLLSYGALVKMIELL
jgi:nicotinamidase-related amidase